MGTRRAPQGARRRLRAPSVRSRPRSTLSRRATGCAMIGTGASAHGDHQHAAIRRSALPRRARLRTIARASPAPAEAPRPWAMTEGHARPLPDRPVAKAGLDSGRHRSGHRRGRMAPRPLVNAFVAPLTRATGAVARWPPCRHWSRRCLALSDRVANTAAPTADRHAVRQRSLAARFDAPRWTLRLHGPDLVERWRKHGIPPATRRP